MTAEHADARRWTVEDIGKALQSHITREQIMETTQAALSEKVDKIYKVLIEGNGEPPLRDTVRQQQKWIEGANKLMWIFITALIGQIVVGGCSLLIALVVLFNGANP